MLRPRLQTFDSGKLADRVGYAVLEDAEAGPDLPRRIEELLEAAAAESFDLLWIESPAKLDTARLEYRGTVVELEGDRAKALAQARLADVRYDVTALKSDSDWDQVEGLMPYAAPTRFSTDAHISEASFRRHKVSLLKSHVENRNGAVALARSADEPGPIGYQCTSVDEDAVQLYDIAVHPRFRHGFAALNLLRWNLERFAELFPGTRRLATRIYDDNVASLRFFQHLGLSPTGRQHHYYHYWPLQPSAGETR
jgi:ribosomal protein S18 acetylase RimI-like enzyme